MKRIISMSLLIAISNVYATPEEDALQAKRMEWSRNYLAKKGGPIPDGGVTVIAAEQMSTYKENKEIRAKMKSDMQKYGYVHEANDQNNRLFNLKAFADRDLRTHGNDFSPRSTHLKTSIEHIKMAYTFVGVPPNEVSESIGFAPYGTYIKGSGWVGAGQFFIKEGLGNCVYTESNVKLSHGAIVIPKEDVRYDINDKATMFVVTGTKASKFLYSVDWYDVTFFRHLECANETYDPSISESIINFAKQIDSYQETRKI